MALAKRNYQFEKRQKALAKLQKKEAKKQRRLERATTREDEPGDDLIPPVESDIDIPRPE